jgi:hypothetical protein
MDRAKMYASKWPGVEKGRRNSTAYQHAACLVNDFALSRDQGLTILKDWNRQNRPSLDDKELCGALSNALAYGKHPKGSKLIARNNTKKHKPKAFVPFPIEALPRPVSTYIDEGAKALGCDTSYIALPMLSALAAAIGNSRRIKLKESWSEPSILWTGIVGDSGTLKSPAIDLALRPLRKKQDEAFKVYYEKMSEYQEDMREYETAMKRRKKNEPLPDKPIEPIAKRYYCSDITIEALAGLLKDAPRGLLLARDELSGWLKSFNAYKKGKGGDDAQWLELHRAGTLLVDRKSGIPKTIHIPNASVSVCGGIQPVILQSALGREHFENGLAARLLLTMPPRRAKQWTEADVCHELQEQIETVFERLLSMKMQENEFGGIEPVDMSLTLDGQNAWIAFYDEHATQQAQIAGGDLAAAWSKLEGYAARLALIIHCVRVACGDESLKTDDFIDEFSIEAAVTIVRWFGQEIRRIYSMLSEDEDQRDQRRLLELIQSRDGRVTARNLMRSSRKFKVTEIANSALQELVDMGWGRWEHIKAGADGGRPSKVFVLNEKSSDDKTPDERPE